MWSGSIAVPFMGRLRSGILPVSRASPTLRFARSSSRRTIRLFPDASSPLSIPSRSTTCLPNPRPGREPHRAAATKARRRPKSQVSYEEEPSRTVQRKKVAVVFPTAWDEKHFQKEHESDARFEVELRRPFDHECCWDF